MNNSLASVLLLILAIALLWAAVTDRLGRWLDGVDVALGTKTAATTTPAPTASLSNSALPMTLPGTNPQAQAGGVTPAALGPTAATTAWDA